VTFDELGNPFKVTQNKIGSKQDTVISSAYTQHNTSYYCNAPFWRITIEFLYKYGITARRVYYVRSFCD